MKTISVLIQRHAGPSGDVLLCRGTSGAWEFPHDRVRTNETDEAAARRVAAEQLGMTVTVGKLACVGRKLKNDGETEHIACGNITHNTHTKDDYHVWYEAVDTWRTGPKSGTYAEFRWARPNELGRYEFADDDGYFIAKYDPWLSGRPIPNVRLI